VRLWHAIDGWNGIELEQLVARFNAAQKDYRFTTGYTGDAQGAARDAREESAALLVLPLQASAVLYYNRDAYRRARLDPAAPPKTWYQMAPAIDALRAAGIGCGYVTASPSEMLLDQIGAGRDAGRLAIDAARVRWVAMLATWQKAGYFSYARQPEEAERRFAAGECALLTAPPSRQAELRASAGFDFGVAPLPGYDDPVGARARGAVGAWRLPGRTEEEYRGVDRLLAFFARPEVQAEWRRRTGFASLAPASYDLAALRELVDRELEAAWNGTKTPIDALGAAVERGNALMRQSGKETVTAKP
jgi:sn-glycerol 3-phosphate transport system substrate-binding protein